MPLRVALVIIVFNELFFQWLLKHDIGELVKFEHQFELQPQACVVKFIHGCVKHAVDSVDERKYANGSNESLVDSCGNQPGLAEDIEKNKKKKRDLKVEK